MEISSQLPHSPSQQPEQSPLLAYREHGEENSCYVASPSQQLEHREQLKARAYNDKEIDQGS